MSLLLVLLPSVLALSSVAWADQSPSSIVITSDTCGRMSLGSPLEHSPSAFSAFSSDHVHYGVDFIAKDEPVLAVADGTIGTIDWNVKTLSVPDARSGMKIRGWGRYIVLHHDDGSESLYAHLDRDSTKDLKVGQAVKTGDVLGKSDTSGGANGPHLHFEYSPTGKIYKNSSKVDPNECVLRQTWLTLESYPSDNDGGAALCGRPACG